LWAKVQPGDIMVFYAIGKGVIGYGVVEGKFESGEHLRSRERKEGKAVWPYRLKIRVEKVFEMPKPRPKGMLVAFAINKLSEEAFKELLGWRLRLYARIGNMLQCPKNAAGCARELLEEFLGSEFDELPEEVRRRVKERVGRELDVRRFKVFLEDPRRIDRVAEYVAKHFRENVDGRFKAMVTAASRKACVLYKRVLDKHLPPEYSEVVMTFQSQEKDVMIEDYKRELLKRYHVTDPKEAVQKIIEKFLTEERPKILIVTDMLLTGFDAPMLQTMYLDKPLKGHRLLQAIARVNRPYRGVKEYGLVIDFIGIFDELERAFAMYESEDLKGAVFDIEYILRNFRESLRELQKLIGSRSTGESEEELFKLMRIKAENLARDKEFERIFVENYRTLRRLYELIAPKLTVQELEEYRWFSDVYTFYTKSFVGTSPEEELAEKYYRKTVEVIGRSMQILEREAEFSPITIDRKFFEEFIRSKDVNLEEKASALIIGISRFKLYARNDPVYVSVADKVEALLDKWRRRLKISLELYEEAKRLWEEIYALKEEQSKLPFEPREYLVYRTLVDAGFEQERAVEVTEKLMDEVKGKISVPGWNLNPKLVRDVERAVAMIVLREVRRAGIPIEDAKKLVDLLIERVKRIESER